MASATQDYIDKYAECSMEQMRKYGIPASVTLAQGILESANGKSQLAKNENNHFGIKASQSWLANGGKYGLYSDDKPNEKFCSYASVSDSYNHHSQFLKNNSRYANCFKLSADDYRGWANGLQKAGYASDKHYAQSLISVIEKYDLNKYDQMVIQNPQQAQTQTATQTQSTVQTLTQSSEYSFPVKRDEFLLVTSPFGMRTDPMDSSKQQMHKGIDIRADHDQVLATESNGKVIAIDNNANAAGGRSIKVEYNRKDGNKVQVSYLHLSSIGVKVGDTVTAGQQLGVSGNTGARTTGPHLHFGVKQVNADGTTRDVDPAAYLAEIAQKGNIAQQVMHNGSDLLAKYKTEQSQELGIDTSLSPDDWMKKLLSSEDSGASVNMGDPVIEMAMTMFTSLMALAVSIDNKTESEQMQTATDAALNKRIDLSSLVPTLKSCELSVTDLGKATLTANDGKQSYSHDLTSAELNRLSLILSGDASDKQQRIASLVSGIITTERVSNNYEQNINNNQSESLQIK